MKQEKNTIFLLQQTFRAKKAEFIANNATKT